MMQSMTLVAIGGAAGSVLRYLAFGLIAAPWGTVVINVAGSFGIGVLYVMLAARAPAAHLLMTGVLGGFTTFSAFSLDALKLWEGGQAMLSLGYVLASVVFSIVAVAGGVAFARGVLA